MTVAMMLPGSLPLLNSHIHPVRQQREGKWSAGLIILGYLAPWMLFGLLAYLGDSFLHRITEPGAPLANFSGMIAPAIVLIAGLYQFSPIKQHYTARCRTQDALNLQLDGEKLTGTAAFKGGLLLGGFCVGSCWSLMLLMFALGHNRLDWMLVLGGIMAAERLAPWGNRLSWLVGLALVVWGSILVLSPLFILLSIPDLFHCIPR
jgi:predicted metal-binding membrane protein